MPLAVRDYTWEETEKMLFLTVPLKGVKANKVDILSSEDYIKVYVHADVQHRNDYDILWTMCYIWGLS